VPLSAIGEAKVVAVLGDAPIVERAPIVDLWIRQAKRNGARVVSEAEGADILTIEGVAHGDKLHPVQAAFIAHDGFQCGFCTPGQIMSAIGMMSEAQAGNDPERIRECMSGNLCRCGAYAGIVDAVLDAQAGMDESNQRRSA